MSREDDEDLKAMAKRMEDDYKEQLNQEYRAAHPEGELYGASVEEMDEFERRREQEEWDKEHPWDDD